MTHSRVYPKSDANASSRLAGEQIAGLPGERMRQLLCLWMSPEHLSRIVDPILADLHAEHLSPPAAELDIERATTGARLRRPIAFYGQLWLQLVPACGLLALLAFARHSPRPILVVSGAALITLSLLLMMHRLIAPAPVQLAANAEIPDVVRAAPPALAKPEPPPPSSQPERPTPPPAIRIPPGGPNKIVIPFPFESVPDTDGSTPGGAIDLSLPRAPANPFAGTQSCFPLARVQPRYPEPARKRGIEGQVRVRVEIDSSGRVVDVAIRDSPHPLLSRAAESAARRWRYQPSAAQSGPNTISGDAGCRSDEVLLSFELPD